MKTLDKSKDKIKSICDTLRRETLEPAEAAAQQIIEEAKKRAETIITDAGRHAEEACF